MTARDTIDRIDIGRLGLRLILILGPALFAVLVVNDLSMQLRIGLLALFLVIPGALVLLRYPELGLPLLVATAVTPPIALGTGTQTTLTIPVLLVPILTGLWILYMVVQERRIHFDLDKIILAPLLLGIVAIAAFIAGQLPWFPINAAPLSAQIGGLAIFLFTAGAFILAAQYRGGSVWVARLVWVFIILSGVQLLANIIPSPIPLRRLFHSMQGSFFVLWTVSLAASQAIFNERLGRQKRILLLLVVLLALFVTLFRFRAWASGWLPSLVALVVVIWAARPRLGFVLMILGAIGGMFFSSDIIDVVILEDNLYSVESRLSAWRIVTEITKVNPILGLGPANYYYYTPLFPIQGFEVRFNSHNQYVDLIAQVGLIGLGLYLWWVVLIGRLGWRLRERARPGFEQAFVYGALGGLAGTVVAGLLGDWVLPFVYNVGFSGLRASLVGWVFLGLLVALNRERTARLGPDTRR